MAHERFHYRTLEELMTRAKELGIELPMAQDTKILATPVKVRNFEFKNRLGIAPMEGADSAPDGSPTEYTVRRYVNEAIGGAAVIWFEAISIVEEGRSSATQLLLTKDNLDAYKSMIEQVKEAGLAANGYAPFCIMQANHSGRYSNPGNKPAPLIAYRHRWLEQFRPADDSCIVTDDYLKGLEEEFGRATKLAKEAGFDAVDIKCCHGYITAELASAYDRPGMYGGSFENRTRFLKNSILAAKPYEDDTFMVTARVGIYDGYPDHHSFGADPETALPDPTEPIRLVKEITSGPYGLDFLDLTMGNPYATTHVTRPFDKGKYTIEEHPLLGIDRMIRGIEAVRREVPDKVIFGSAPSYLRQYADLYTAGAIEQGICDGMLFGRLSFAQPDFANQIIRNGRLDPKRICVTCGMCGDLIRAHKPTGCVVRDSKTFMPFYQEFVLMKPNLPKNFRG